jgi:hypothetical protein
MRNSRARRFKPAGFSFAETPGAADNDVYRLYLELARGWFFIEAKVCIMASITKAAASVPPLFEDDELSSAAEELSFERGES